MLQLVRRKTKWESDPKQAQEVLGYLNLNISSMVVVTFQCTSHPNTLFPAEMHGTVIPSPRAVSLTLASRGNGFFS